MLGEGALVAEGVGFGDVDDFVGGLDEGFGGGLDADAEHEFIGRDAEGLVDLAIQRALGEAAFASEFGGAEDAAGVLLDVADDERDFAAGLMPTAAFIAAGEAHEADDPAVLASQWDLGREKPSQRALLVIPDFEAIDQRFARAKDERVIGSVGLGRLLGIEVFVESANDLGFTFEAQAGPHRPAGSDEAALAILHKEEHVGLLIKHEPECLRIGHAGKKGALNGLGRHGRIITRVSGKASAKYCQSAMSLNAQFLCPPLAEAWFSRLGFNSSKPSLGSHEMRGDAAARPWPCDGALPLLRCQRVSKDRGRRRRDSCCGLGRLL